MTEAQKRKKLISFLCMVGYFTFGYLAINWFSARRDGFFDLSTRFDAAIPFVPIFIFGYILVYLSVALACIIDDPDDWRRVVISFFLATSVAYSFFILVPVRMNLRPVLAGLSGTSAAVTGFFYIIDLPYNCFPSLHVTYPTLVTLAMWRNHAVMRWVLAAMTAVVAVSVVLVKQHYVADVAAGFLSAALCFWLVVKLEGKWSKWFISSSES
ncbi:MAG: phosphatase PAP2 family protein [Pseudomonadota bacterium]